jgi:signal transduction histidine kinase
MGYDGLLQRIQETRQSGTSFAGEIEWPDKRIFSAAITSIKEGGCVVVLHDVSRFKELEKVKDEFIATASHDLRNPITSINGFSHLMKQAGPLNEMQIDFMTRIQEAAIHMGQLVDNMLNLAKMDLGQDLRHENVDLSQLLTKVTDEFKPHAQAKGQSLTLEEEAANSRVSGDELQLLQALRNLVGNAIKYTPENGSITIGLGQKDGRSLIKVRDTGYGIPAASLPFIFNRFYRVRNNGHSEIEGNGLGLAIVKSIIEQHDGEVTVESEPGAGSCFTVSLPSLVTMDTLQPQRISSTKYNNMERGTK